jgi:hypothetical protein
MISLDSDSLKFWQSFAEWGFGLVIVGVFGESVDLVAKWVVRCRKRRLPKQVDRWMLPLESSFWIILCVGLAMEFLGGHKAMLIADRQNAILTDKAEQAGKDAEQAKERASKLDLVRVELEEKVEELRKKNDEFEAQQLPRLIEQIRTVDRLKQFSGIKAAIIAANDGGDSVRTAAQISSILHSANWDVGDIIFTFAPVPSGISTGICSTNELWRGEMFERMSHGIMPVPNINSGIENFSKLEDICAAFAEELNRQGIATKRDEDINRETSLRFNGILIFVGKKPTVLESQIISEKHRLEELDQKKKSPTNHFNWEIKQEWSDRFKKLTDLEIKQALGTAVRTNREGGQFILPQYKLP